MSVTTYFTGVNFTSGDGISGFFKWHGVKFFNHIFLGVIHIFLPSPNEPVEKPPHCDKGVVFGGLLTPPQYEIVVYRAS